MKTLKLTPLALLIAVSFSAPAAWAQQAATAAATDVGKIAVEGQPGGTGTGLLVQEETPKARSSVNRAHMDKLNPAGNPYQAIELLPGVSTFSYDGTGLFGGGLRVRGANSDQMGFTINGAPVNDSGSFSVFPQEYTDSENLCEVFVTQGSTDTEAPHVGASGGNVGMVSCAPADKFGVRLEQSLGQLSFTKSYVRIDSGKFANDMAKAYLSYSKASADKFKGLGKADRTHIDFGAEFKPNDAFLLSTSFLYNKAINNNLRAISYPQIAAGGRSLDFLTTVPQHLVGVSGTAQNESVLPALASCSTATNCGYYGFNINPFKNYLWTGKAEFKASKDLSFSVEPYFWYGYGTGGSQLGTVAEGLASTKLGGGIKDINGDGDTLDTVMVYGSSVTRTYRPGVTLKTSARVGVNNILAGLWVERARHFQTAPRQTFDNNGGTADLWLDTPSAWIQRANGLPYEARNQLTVSTGSSLFIQDSIDVVQDKLNLQVGLRDSKIKRKFNNYANEGTRQGADYEVDKTYSKVLPSIGLRYTVDAQSQVFFNVAENMKAPGNFSYGNLMFGGTYVNGVLTGATQRDPVVGMETSTNMDIGYRYAGDTYTFSGSVYHVDFKNRIATAFDSTTATSIDFNVGAVKTEGFEMEAGYRLNANWSMYGSVSYTDSRMQDNLIRTSATYTESTAGKQMPDTPEWLSGLSVSYVNGPWYAKLDTKFTGRAYSTLVNDEQVKATTIVGAAFGYKLGSMGFLKNAELMVNVSNLFNKEYERINSGSGSNFTTRALAATGAPAGSAPLYYIGAPRFTAVTLKTAF